MTREPIVPGLDGASRQTLETIHRQHRVRRPRRRTGRLRGRDRDDLDLRVAGAPARTMASQGQARSLVLAWKLAELEAARDASGEAPLFLMDDLGSELDPKRTAALMELLRSLGAQVFVSTTDLRFLPRASAEARLYRVEAGAVTG